jgi:hypothetical protein
MDEKDSVSKEGVFSSIVSEAAGFYKVIIAVASSFLGGSLVFMEKTAPDPTTFSLVVLGIGWLALIASIALVVTVRRLNLESGWRAMEENYDEARRIDKKTRKRSKWSARLLIFGMSAIMLFGVLNIRQSNDKKGDPNGQAYQERVEGNQEKVDSLWRHAANPSGPATDGAEQTVSPPAQTE